MPPKIDNEAFAWIGEQMEPPAPRPPPKEGKPWMPRQTRAQRELFDSTEKAVLCWGPKGGAKSYGCVEKLVKHCYRNRNALAMILVTVQNMAVKGGSWDILTNEVLPKWRDGNPDPTDPTRERRTDEGMGLVYTDVKYDANHCPFIWIQNKYGSWSMITVMSCPHANQLRLRIRGVAPSMIFLDEATSCSGHEYYESAAAQLGRRPQVEDPQQFIAATNPEDPDHWVFLKWFIEPYDEATGAKDPAFRDIFFPAEDNKVNLPPGYLEGLVSVYGKNATEAARMIGGEWVSAPSGDAIFAGLFSVITHVRPLNEQMQPHKDEWLEPNPAYPMILGIDPGSVYNSFIFLQRLPMKERFPWVVFDEVVILRKRISFGKLIPAVMRRIRFWRDTVGAEMPMVWISDENAFNVFRANTGSFDNLEIEKAYEMNRAALNLEPMRMRPCPKFNGSVDARLTLMESALAEEQIIVSSRCVRVRQMLEKLECEKQKPGAPFDPKLARTPRRSDHIHVFDGATYPMLAAATKPSLLVPPRKGGGSTLISVGSRAA